MQPQRFKVFTLEEANRALHEVVGLTRRTQHELDELRESFRAGESQDVEEAIRGVLDRWARAILAMGAQPKGIFTVDFRSPDPNVLWCWAPDEDNVCHRHFTWESFKDRVPIRADGAFWPSQN